MVFNEPLGLPPGSVRAILALGTVFSSIALLAIGKINMDQLLAITGVVLAFYFVERRDDSTSAS